MPGPGNYAQDDASVTKNKAPKFGFGTSKRNNNNEKLGPGPGNYAARTFTGEENPKYSMGITNNYDPSKKE